MWHNKVYRGLVGPRTGPLAGFDMLRQFNQGVAQHGAAMSRAHKAAKYPGGVYLEIRRRDRSVPIVHRQDLADAAVVVKRLGQEVYRRHVYNGHDPRTAPSTTFDDVHIIPPSGVVGSPDEHGGFHAHGHFIAVNSSTAGVRSLGAVGIVKDSLRALHPAHEELHALAHSYHGTSVPHPDLATVGDFGQYHAYPHYHNDGSPLAVAKRTRNNHAHVFHFDHVDDAWRAMTALPAGMRDARITDHEGNEVMNLLTKPTSHAFGESARGGALRRPDGKFASTGAPGGAQWVENVPTEFRTRVESLGGKVKRSGGGLALLFKTVDEALKAHHDLSEEGHRVSPHDIPGILFVSHIANREPPVQEAAIPKRLEGNPRLSDALDLARHLGASVTTVNRTGEVRITHPEWHKPITLNNRRKDTARELVKSLNQQLKKYHGPS